MEEKFKVAEKYVIFSPDTTADGRCMILALVYIALSLKLPTTFFLFFAFSSIKSYFANVFFYQFASLRFFSVYSL
jgi:hypothetical protein